MEARLSKDATGRRGPEISPLQQRMAARDFDAFDAIYRRYFEGVYAYLRVLLRNDHDAEDVTQLVFVKLIENVDSYDDRGHGLQAWLMRVAHNAGVDLLRKRKWVSAFAPSDVDLHREIAVGGQGSDPLDRLSDHYLLTLIEDLPVLQRQIIVLHFMLGLRSVEIARVVNRSPQAVRQAKRRALAALAARTGSLHRGGEPPAAAA